MTDVNVTIGASKGIDGDDGREIEIQNNGTHIQWRYAGDVSWTNLVALSALTGATGATGIVPRGVYDSLESYVVNDAVTHNGSFYICIQASQGNNPSNVQYWTKYVDKGDTGATGGVNSVNTRQGDVTLAKADVGLSNVDNTSDVNKPISSATQTALNGKSDIGHVHDASVITSGTIDAARLPSGATSAVTYGAYGPTAMTVDGYAYTLTYENGKVKTVTGAGKTKTYTWSGDDLVSVVVS